MAYKGVKRWKGILNQEEEIQAQKI
jgi:hypothetical protein